MSFIEKQFNLKGKVAILTGGAGVLAGQMAEGLIRAGVKIILLGRTTESLESKASELSKYGEAIGLACDVLDREGLEKTRKLILNRFKKIDILINAAGGNMPGATIPPDKTLFDMDMDDFQKVSDLNLNGSVLPSLIFGEVMAKQRSGSILNITSMAADQVITRVVGYSASKAAITNFTKWMAVEMAQKFGEGIRVNALAPGFFIAKQNKSLLTNKDGSFTDRGQDIIRNTPMGRFGQADELIGATLYLCSDAAKFVTGAVLPVDGGFSIFSGV